jgi:acyl dehydratase
VRTIRGRGELEAAVGEELGATTWREVTQRDIDAFAAATGDDYWIHVDPERAAATPLGSTVAHGLLTLSLGPAALYELVAFEGFSMAMNYGYGKVRFPAPLPVGARVRMRARLAGVADAGGGAQLTIHQTFEREGHDKPVCVAEMLIWLGD